MILSTIKKAIIVCLFFYLPTQTKAWGTLGHRIVGQIADAYLTPKARLEIGKILGTESVAMASNWADFIKSDSTLNYLSAWHYMDVEGGLNHNDFMLWLKKDTIADAYTKLNFLIKELKNKHLALDKKQMYLRLLIHIVGDIHQPLHVGHPEDKGGNSIRVSWLNAPTNLHSVWDSRLIDMQQLSYTEYAAAINHPTKMQRLSWQAQPISEWLFHSYEVVQNIYADVKQDDKLGYQYNFKYLDVLNQQLLMGGVHLAGLLNQIFK